MQTIDFITTAKWIVAQYSDDTRISVLRGRIRSYAPDTPSVDPEGSKLLNIIMGSVTELAVVAERLNAHPGALEILRAFGVASLAERGFAIRVAEQFVSPGARERLARFEFDEQLRAVWDGWWKLEDCISPVEKLTIPTAVTGETDFDDILTLELRYDSPDLHPKAESVAKILEYANDLYSAISRSLGVTSFPPLQLIYADSGSAVRFDFKGLGEAIRESKQLLVDLWSRFRHRRPDDYRANAEALLGGLKIVAGIETLAQQGAISSEDASRYKAQILDAGIRLFESGSLPREVPRVEVVPNQVILNEIQRKFLPLPEVQPDLPPTEKKKRSRKSSRLRKRG